MTRVVIDGKQFACEGQRYPFRGVTYGTFAPREDGALFPEAEQVKRDFSQIAERGFTVVRTYTAPPDDVLQLAAEWQLHVLAGVFYPDWRYLLDTSRRSLRALTDSATQVVAAEADRMAGNDTVLALCLGNEVPADVVRWVGADEVRRSLAAMADAAREVDPDRLLTYAHYPTAEHLALPDMDFVTFNVFLEETEDFRRYLNRLHNLAGDRPLVLGELGLHAGEDAAGEARQAELLDAQLEAATERGVAGTCVFSWTDDWVVGGTPVTGWRFGLTTADRRPRPALDVIERWNRSGVADLDHPWPSVSVVICAYNAEATIDECLRHTCALPYPDLEILVIDDGSTDATAEIARRHPRATVVSIPHAGLSVARNEGFRRAQGDLIAYLDSDAYPTREWLHYLVLGLNNRDVAAVGGPNVPPRGGPPGAQIVAQAPGGPVHVLIADDRAEHIPGCNMAFWRYALEEVGGFDPIYTAAGDDVDVCWKVLDRGYEIGFHPAALVWHHRRAGLRTYLRQQRGYGRAEALVESRHPDRFTALGTARWNGRIYNSLIPRGTRQRIYRGAFGAAPFQPSYSAAGHGLDVAHQVGVPIAAAALATLPMVLAGAWYGAPALAGALFLASLFAVDALRARPPRTWTTSRNGFRARVASHHILQPLVRLWGRWSPGSPRRDVGAESKLPQTVRRADRGTFLLPADRPRPELAAALVAHMRGRGLRTQVSTGWEDYDARLRASGLLSGDLVTSAFPEGCIQVRIRRHVHGRRAAAVALLCAALGSASPVLGVVLAALATGDMARGSWRLRAVEHRVLAEPGSAA